MRKIVFASNNQNKLSEIQHLLKGIVDIVSLKEIGFDQEIDETETTLEGNALLKAHAIYDQYGFSVFADDTGLEVDVLDGAPGVYSARYAGEACNAEDNMKKVLTELEGEQHRTARFRTVIALILDGQEHLFEGSVQGQILEHKQGEKGFGYDPIFQADGYAETFAQLPLSVKNEISHRGLAVKKLVTFLKEL